jgi:hypothetical protein
LANEQGLQIQVELKMQRHTQRWLLGELKKRGVNNVDEHLLSHILNGRYPYRLGREVLVLADEILKQERNLIQKYKAAQ